MMKKIALLVLAALFGLFLIGSVNAVSINEIGVLQVQSGTTSEFNLSAKVTGLTGAATYAATAYDEWTNFNIDATTGNITIAATEDDEGIHILKLNVTDTAATAIRDFYIFVSAEATGKLEINSVDLDEDSVAPGDEDQLDFTLENKLSSEDMTDVSYTINIIANDGDDLLDDEIEVEDLELEDDDDYSATLKIPYDAEEDDYFIVIQAFATGDDNDIDYAAAYVEKVSVERNKHDMLIDSLIAPDVVECGDTIEVSVKAVNIGTEEEDDVFIEVFENDLELSEKTEVFTLDDKGDDSEAVRVLTLEIPGDAKPGTDYLLTARVTYNTDDTALMTRALTVECESPAVPAKAVSLSATSATIESDETAKFTITLTNFGKTSVDYTLLVSADWAEADVDPAEITLAAGEETTAYVYLRPDSDAEGTNTAKLSVYSGSDLVSEQDLRVTVEEAESEGSHILSKEMWTSTDGIATLILIIAILAVIAMFLYSKGAKPSREK